MMGKVTAASLVAVAGLALRSSATRADTQLLGNEHGNGGDAVVCRGSDGSIDRAMLLDFYEATQRSIRIVLGEPSDSVEEKVEIALSRLERFSRERGRRLREWWRLWSSESAFLPGIDLPDTPDSDHRDLPRGCVVEQLAEQREPPIPGDPRYIVSKDLWDALDSNDDRAGLIIHELVYRDLKVEGHETSVYVRYFTSILSSDRLDGATLEDFATYATNAHIRVLDVGRYRFDLSRAVQFYPGGWLVRSALLAEPHSVVVQPSGGSINWSATVQGLISFFETGEPERMDLVPGHNVPLSAGGNLPIATAGETLVMYPGRKVKRGAFQFDPTRPARFEASHYDFTLSSANGQALAVPLEFTLDDQVESCGSCSGWVAVGGRRILIAPSPMTGWEPWSYRKFGDGFALYLAEDTFATTPDGLAITLSAMSQGNFDEQGASDHGRLAAPTALRAGDRTVFARGAPCHFSYEDGALFELVLAEPAYLPFADGGEREIAAGTFLQLDAAGKVETTWEDERCDIGR